MAAFLALAARRDEGQPLGALDDERSYLGDLQQRFDRWASELVRARTTRPPFVAVLGGSSPPASGEPIRARLLESAFHTCRGKASFRTPDAGTVLPSSLTARFWVNARGMVIGDSAETPPDGYPVCEWLVESQSRWIRYEDCLGRARSVDLDAELDELARDLAAQGR